MFLADRPGRFDHPGQCVIIPGRVHDPNGGVLLDTTLDGAHGDIRLWLSYAGLQKIVDQFGGSLNLAHKDSLDLAYKKIADLEFMLAESNAALEAAEGKLERINGVSRDGFKIVRQQGRPAKKVAV